MSEAYKKLSLLLVTLLHLFDFTFKSISFFMSRVYFSHIFRGYNDHISIKNLCFQINNFWMVLLDMTTIRRIPCQSLVLSIFLDVTYLFDCHLNVSPVTILIQF